MEGDGHTVVYSPVFKYLGDAKQSFREHLEYLYQRAISSPTALAEILLNIGGWKHCRRLFLSGVVRSILFCASSVWREVLLSETAAHEFGLPADVF